MKEKISKLVDVKSIVTLLMTGALIVIMFAPIEPPQEFVALFCTSYGAITTYFFTRRQNGGKEGSDESK